jgi:carbonic anhydrase
MRFVNPRSLVQRGWLTCLLSGLLLIFVTACAAKPARWTYAGDKGPERWARLTPEFSACQGKNQSPIDLTRFIEADLEPITFAYRAGGNVIVNTGHTVQVDYAAGSSISVDGIRFVLTQFHFHAPGEHRIDGRSYPMEAHLVHVDPSGNLAVVALMFEEGRENQALAALWRSMPEREGRRRALPASFDVNDLLPVTRDYYRVNGSLTTPPCTEGVRWLVLKTPVSVSSEQVAAFARVMKHPNNRPVQPVNARPVLR